MDTDPKSGSTILSADACWALVRTTQLGRLAVSVANRPDIFPINFLVDHGSIVFRTAEGTKLAATATSPNVAFEVDGYDTAASQAWSVVIKGRAEEITGLYDLLESATLPLFPWQPGPKDRFVRIVATETTGRQFRVADPAIWRNSMTDAPHAPLE
jgi:hypothetical protein